MQRFAVPLALVIGAILGFFARPMLTGKGETAPGDDVAELRSENTSLRAQLEGATSPAPDKLPTAILPSDGPDTTTITEGPVTITSSGDGPKSINLDFGGLGELMKKQQQQQDGRRTALELAQLKARLNLTLEQEEKVRALLEAQAANKRGDLAKVLSLVGNDNDEVDVEELFEEGADTFAEDLAALLDPDQKASYDEYVAEQRANAIEASASRDLAQLQSMFPLTEDQKDRAFEAFGQLAADTEDAGAPSGLAGMGKAFANRDERLGALEPILTDEQMDIYKNSPQLGNTMIFGADGGTLGNGGVISTIQIDATAGSPLILGGLKREEE